jgi:hypothetical protein
MFSEEVGEKKKWHDFVCQTQTIESVIPPRGVMLQADQVPRRSGGTDRAHGKFADIGQGKPRVVKKVMLGSREH